MPRATTDEAPGNAILTVEKIGRSRERTPEGYLLCRDVALGRTGVMIYVEGEIPDLKAKPDGVIYVVRTPEELFSDVTISSGNGKPVAIGHTMIFPDNFAEFSKGSGFNLHRGTGTEDDLLLGDLLIQDEDAIEAVEGGLVEISLGYDADYRQSEPGKAEQYNIVINHIALVENGRCGPRCAIGDTAMAFNSIAARIRKAFYTKDEAALEKALCEGTKDEIGDPAADPGSHHVIVNVHGNQPAVVAESEKPKEAVDEDPAAVEADPMKAVMEMLTKIDARLTAVEGAVAKSGEAEATETKEEPAAAVDEDKPLEVEKKDEKDGGTADDAEEEEKKDEKKPTTDSASTAAAILEVKARAEILVPGVKFPTFDAKDAKITESLCAFRRRVLKHAATHDGASSKIVKPLLGAGTDLKAMTCDAVNIAFHAASDAMRAENNGKNRSFKIPGGKSFAAQTRDTLATVNKQNEDFWKSRQG